MDYLASRCAQENVPLTEKVHTQLDAYMQLLTQWNKVHNLTAVTDPQAQIDHLLLPSLFIQPYIKHYQKLIDLGTGGGFPGLALAILDHTKQWILVEKSPKKCAFLRHVAQKLAVKNVQVQHIDFSRIPVDNTVDAIITRGSCKLPMQLKLTTQWRAHSVPLLSVQSQESLDGFSLHKSIAQHNLSYVQQDTSLKLLIIPPGVDLE